MTLKISKLKNYFIIKKILLINLKFLEFIGHIIISYDFNKNQFIFTQKQFIRLFLAITFLIFFQPFSFFILYMKKWKDTLYFIFNHLLLLISLLYLLIYKIFKSREILHYSNNLILLIKETANFINNDVKNYDFDKTFLFILIFHMFIILYDQIGSVIGTFLDYHANHGDFYLCIIQVFCFYPWLIRSLWIQLIFCQLLIYRIIFDCLLKFQKDFFQNIKQKNAISLKLNEFDKMELIEKFDKLIIIYKIIKNLFNNYVKFFQMPLLLFFVSSFFNTVFLMQIFIKHRRLHGFILIILQFTSFSIVMYSAELLYCKINETKIFLYHQYLLNIEENETEITRNVSSC